MFFLEKISKIKQHLRLNWTPPSLSELTPMIFNMGLTHLGLEASNSYMKWI